MMLNKKQPEQPEILAGFESISRYWEPVSHLWMAKILPGEFYISRGGEVITTVLGSCISVCIRDPDLGIAGMNHFMLPEKDSLSVQDSDRGVQTLSRYGNWAIEYLLNELFKMGCQKSRLEVKLFGGSSVLFKATDIGSRNAAFAQSFFKRDNMPLSAIDVGGHYPRKIRYVPETGKVFVKRLIDQQYQSLIHRERRYLDDLSKPETSSIEVFD